MITAQKLAHTSQLKRTQRHRQPNICSRITNLTASVYYINSYISVIPVRMSLLLRSIFQIFLGCMFGSISTFLVLTTSCSNQVKCSTARYFSLKGKTKSSQFKPFTREPNFENNASTNPKELPIFLNSNSFFDKDIDTRYEMQLESQVRQFKKSPSTNLFSISHMSKQKIFWLENKMMSESEKFCWKHQDYGLILDWQAAKKAKLKNGCAKDFNMDHPAKTYSFCRNPPRLQAKMLPKIPGLCEFGNFLVKKRTIVTSNNCISLPIKNFNYMQDSTHVRNLTGVINENRPVYINSVAFKGRFNFFHQIDLLVNTFLALRVAQIDPSKTRIWYIDMVANRKHSPVMELVKRSFAIDNHLHDNLYSVVSSIHRSDPIFFKRVLIHAKWPGSMLLVYKYGECHHSNFVMDMSRYVLSGLGILQIKTPRIPTILFSVRRRTKNRNVGRIFLNEKDIENMLKSGEPYVRTVTVDFSSMPLREQIEAARRSNLYLGAHGAGLIHVMFLADEAALVEIHPSYRRMQHFRNIARLAGKMYMPFNKASVKCKGTSDGLIVDVEALRSFLDPLIAIIRSFRSPLDFCGLEKHCMDKLKKVPDTPNPCTDRGGNKHIEVKKTPVNNTQAMFTLRNEKQVDPRSPFSGNVAIIIGQRGKSCTSACNQFIVKKQKTGCHANDLKQLNNCTLLNLVTGFQCSVCRINEGGDHPSIQSIDESVYVDAEFASSLNVCFLLTPSAKFSCTASHKMTRRICPCRIVGKIKRKVTKKQHFNKTFAVKNSNLSKLELP